MAERLAVVWTPAALRDLAAQLEYIEAESPRASTAVGEVIQRASRGLQDFPRKGRPGRRPGTRELVVVGTSFLLIHRERSGKVEVLRLLHGAQRWPPRR